jgi:hypothetical protein
MQSELIHLGNHLLEIGECVQSKLRPMYFLVLQKIIMRGELSLVSLSLASSDPKLPAKVMAFK